jgi:hypothetical protein
VLGTALIFDARRILSNELTNCSIGKFVSTNIHYSLLTEVIFAWPLRRGRERGEITSHKTFE